MTTTVTCSACGGANARDDAFCGSCSAFLEWDGAAAPAAPDAHARSDAHPAPAEQVPVGAAVGVVGSAASGTPAPSGAPGTATAPAPTASGGAQDDLGHRAPQAEALRRAPRRAPAQGPTDQFCGACGAGNAAGRSFCRRCGHPLEDPEPGPAAGWFDRRVRPLWPFGRRGHERAAGERPRSWERHAARQERPRGLRRPRIGLAGLAVPLMVLSLLGLGIAPLRAKATAWVFDTYDDVRRTVAPELVEVTPAGAVADSQTEGHPGGAAVDQNSASYWSEGREGPGIGATLQVTFDAPTDLTRIGVLNGATEADYARQPRLRTLQVDMVDVAGTSSTARLELADTAQFRTYALGGTAVSSLTITVVDVYPGQEGEDASLTEVSFHTSR